MVESGLLAIRGQKLGPVQSRGGDACGGRFEVDGTIAEVREKFVEGQSVRVAGRITAHRNMGKSQFLDLRDITGRLQIFISLKELSPDDAETFALLDVGDFIGVQGEYFKTRTGELTVRVESF